MFQLQIKKGIVITMILVILAIVLGQGINAAVQDNHISQSSSDSVEFIDQSNGGAGCGGCGSTGVYFLEKGVSVAQSFIPTQGTVSKISITLSKSGTPPVNTKIMLSVRDSLYGDDLTSTEVDAMEGSVMFDFTDIDVTPGNSYYMIVTSDNSSAPNNGYGWSYTKTNHYVNGSAWVQSASGDWNSLDDTVSAEGADMFFESYWKDYCPNLPTINGINSGKAQTRYEYTFSAIDPEGDDVYYFVDWGDGKSVKWAGPYESGEEVTKSHQWATQGNYTVRVKARDVYGAESDWSTLQISLPKYKMFHLPFFEFIRNYPNLFPIVHYILGLL